MTMRQLFMLQPPFALLLCLCGAFAGQETTGGASSKESFLPDTSYEEIRDFYERHRETLFTSNTEVWVKVIIAPSLEKATEARRRAEDGENFDELIAEYFVPHFAAHRKERHISKRVDYGWVSPSQLWAPGGDDYPISGLNVGDVSEPTPLFGKGPDYAVLKIVAERPGRVAKLEEVKDNIYSRFWYELANRKMLQELDLGRKPWCGTCRATRNVNGQLWHLAQHYSERGDKRKAISACLLALPEERNILSLDGPETNENGLYPEEQFLVDQGMDIIRYYAGSIDRVIRGHQAGVSDGLPWRVSRMKDERVVPLLTRLAANRGRWSQSATYALGSIKAKSAVPTLKELLSDRQIHIVEHHWGQKEAIYAYYYLRAAARDALRRMGVDPGEVKVVVGAVKGDPLPENYP